MDSQSDRWVDGEKKSYRWSKEEKEQVKEEKEEIKEEKERIRKSLMTLISNEWRKQL